MRIIAGKYKSRKLIFPKDKPELRPTKDMVKEALFSIIQNRVFGARFLDLYAGVGSIGLEALSRGAEEVVFIDKNTDYIYENVKNLGLLEEVKIYRNNVDRAIEILHRRGEKFDLIFLDPPYNTLLAEISLNKLFCFDILKKGGLIILETDRKKAIKTEFKISSERIYGQTKLVFMERASEA